MRAGTIRQELVEEVRAERQAAMDAQIAAMTPADWKYIEIVIEALRERYPALHIEVGQW